MKHNSFSDIIKDVRNGHSPAYVYDLRVLAAQCELVKSHLPQKGQVHFAMKANNDRKVLGVIKRAGFGVDVVSGGELELALSAGFSADHVVFSGVGKTKDEIDKAIAAGVLQLNIESVPELLRVAERSEALKKKIRVGFRMNPDVGAGAHPYIQTGLSESKFGLDFSELGTLLEVVKKHKNTIEWTGLALHIGSQIRELAPFQIAIKKLVDLYKYLSGTGHNLSVIDVGGGVGIDYHSSDFARENDFLIEYFKAIEQLTEDSIFKTVFFEPGRILVARSGTLITEVQYVKRTPNKNFLIVDTGMNHLLRPALYRAEHRIDLIANSEASPGASHEVFDVVGPICESADVLGYARAFPTSVAAGDLLGVRDVGAYGMTMASDYNMRARPYTYYLE